MVNGQIWRQIVRTSSLRRNSEFQQSQAGRKLNRFSGEERQDPSPKRYDGRYIIDESNRGAWKLEMLNEYKPDDAIVLFSGKRRNFPGIGRRYLASPDFQDITSIPKELYRSDSVYSQTDFRAQTLVNLAMNLCAYREFYSSDSRFSKLKIAIGFGIGELAALVVSNLITTEDAFAIASFLCDEVAASEKEMQTHAAICSVKNRHKVNLACHDARDYVSKTRGFTLEDAHLIPEHEEYGIPTTVDVAARIDRYNILIAGHLVGIQYIARQANKYNIQNVQVIPNYPALNTMHFQRSADKLSNLLSELEAGEPFLDVWNFANLNSKSKPFNLYQSVDLYSPKNLQYLLPKTLFSRQILWQNMINALLNYKNKEGKMDYTKTPTVIEIGQGGSFGLSLRDIYGYELVKQEKYRWLDVGESEQYKMQHQQLLTRWNERTWRESNSITASY